MHTAKTILGTLLRSSLIIGALMLPGSIAKAVDLIFTNESANSIQGVDFDGSNLTTLINTGLDEPRSIAYNSSNGLIYFADTSNSAIKRATTSGASVTTLFSGLDQPSGIALDVTNGHIYFTEDGTRIRRANLDGTGSPTTLISGLSENPRGIALDVANNHMYWTNSNTNESIERANLDGSNRSIIYTTSGSPKNIRLDISNQLIYYTNNAGGSSQGVWRVEFDGSNPTRIINATGYTGIDLDLTNSRMYLTNQLNETIERANIDGTGLTTLTSLSGSPDPYGIVIIPEPSTYALLLGALALGVAGYLRHRSKDLKE
ncbi:MAG TPA: hypothetical protein DIU37_03290 [Opitutae bacterium]|nr:hypothetical protein [Opitutae bacterium]|tara:strand:- start:1930 stop:2880 length:951 start_codon:yes stop_codon:yes gene_type:complete